MKRNEPRPEPTDNPGEEVVEVFSSPCGFSWDSLDSCREDGRHAQSTPVAGDDGSD